MDMLKFELENVKEKVLGLVEMRIKDKSEYDSFIEQTHEFVAWIESLDELSSTFTKTRPNDYSWDEVKAEADELCQVLKNGHVPLENELVHSATCIKGNILAVYGAAYKAERK